MALLLFLLPLIFGVAIVDVAAVDVAAVGVAVCLLWFDFRERSC